jgi:hypothetical protein
MHDSRRKTGTYLRQKSVEIRLGQYLYLTAMSSPNAGLLPHEAPIDSNGRTALSSAAAMGNLSALYLLVRRGADVNAADRDGRRALSYAAESGHVEVVRALAELGAEINDVDSAGRTALSYAEVNGHIDIVRTLLELDAVRVSGGRDAAGPEKQRSSAEVSRGAEELSNRMTHSMNLVEDSLSSSYSGKEPRPTGGVMLNSGASSHGASTGASRSPVADSADISVEPQQQPKIMLQGCTIKAGPGSSVGDRGVVNGIEYTIRDRDQLQMLIRQKEWDEVERTCTSFITDFSRLFERADEFDHR